MILRKNFTAKRHFDYVRRLSSLRRFAPVIMVAGIVIAAWGQYILLNDRASITRGALFMTVGGLAFLTALLMGWQSLDARALLDEEEEESVATSFPWGLRQKVGLAIGILGGLAGFFLNDNNTYTAGGFSLWLVGCLALVLAFWPLQWRARFRLPKLHPSSAWVLVVLVFTLGVAAFLRFFDLDNIPLDMGSDHSAHIFDIRAISDGVYQVFFPQAQGREGLFFYLGVGLTPFFGHSFLTLKVLTAILGVLSVAATYFMTKELFGNRRVALIAAILISLSFWHIILSRMGWRPSLLTLTTALTLLFLFRALKYNRSSDFVFSGLFLGLGMYAYQAGRLEPLAIAPILIISFLILLFAKRPKAPLFLINAVLLVLTASIVFAPLGRYALDEPGPYWGRVSERVTEGPGTLAILGDNIKRTHLMFNWEGGLPGIRNAPDSAQLEYLTGAAFALGIGAMAVFWLLRRRGLNAYAAFFLLVMLVPSWAVLFPIEVPHPTRTAGAIPLIFAVAALPLYIGFEFLVRAFGRAALVPGLALLGVALGLIGFVNYHTYFDEYAGFYLANSRNFKEIGTVFRDFEERGGDLDNAYLKLGSGLDLKILAIEIGDLDWRNGYSDIDEPREHALNPEAKLYVLSLDDGIGVLRLREIYSRGSLYKFTSPTRSVLGQGGDRGAFFVFLVPAEGGAPMTPLPNTHLVR